MAGPWERFAGQPQSGPWEKFAPSEPASGSRAGAFLRSFAQGLTANFGDEIGAAAAMAEERDAPLAQQSQVNPYQPTLGAIRKKIAADDSAYPGTTLTGNLLGGVALGGGLAKGGVSLLNSATSVPSAIARGAAEGAMYGAAYGAGEGESGRDRLSAAARGATSGAITGGVVGGLGHAIARPKQPQAPSLEELRTAAGSAYKVAENAGVVIAPQSFAQRIDDIAQTVAKEGIDPTLHPRATAALQRLKDSSQQPLSLQNVETLRRVVKNSAASLQPDERRIAAIMTEKLDDFVSNLGPNDVVSGNSAAASSALKEARGLWSRMSKGDVVEDLMENARVRAGQFSGSGYENALRTEFRQLVLNPKRLRLFNAEEQAALKRVAQGGPLENALRLIGKAAPTGIVSSALSSGAGFALGGGVGAAVVPALGYAGRTGATILTDRNARIASELMRRGGKLPLQSGSKSAAYAAALIAAEEAANRDRE